MEIFGYIIWSGFCAFVLYLFYKDLKKSMERNFKE